MLAAAIRAPRITSAITAIQVKTTSTGTAVETGTIWYRTKPTLVISEDLHTHGSSPITETKKILTRKYLYSTALTADPNLSEMWVRLSMDGTSESTRHVFQFQLQDLQEKNFTGQAQLFAADRDPRVVRTQTIGGVPTTEYAGSFRASAALRALPANLPASLRKILRSRLADMGDDVISFREWLDGQHNVRRAVEVDTGGIVVVVTINVTAIDQPVQIAVPAASQFPPGSGA